MTNHEGLSPIMQSAYDALPEDLRSAFIEELHRPNAETIRGAIARIMARNMSHSVGSHLLGKR